MASKSDSGTDSGDVDSAKAAAALSILDKIVSLVHASLRVDQTT